MKRHEALAPLSREHHEALILAQLLKKDAPAYKGLPQLPKDKAVYAANFYHNNLRKHFLQEEQMLEKVKQYHIQIEEITPEIIYEHQHLTRLFISLDNTAAVEATMDALGKALEAHVRKEERILFPLIQQHCPEAILNTMEW